MKKCARTLILSTAVVCLLLASVPAFAAPAHPGRSEAGVGTVLDRVLGIWDGILQAVFGADTTGAPVEGCPGVGSESSGGTGGDYGPGLDPTG
jgi:hypothetical protein